MRILLRDGVIHGGGTAMLVEDGVIGWLGSGAPPAADEVVGLNGALVTPAFVDAHVHATSTGLLRTGLDLTRCASLADCLDAVRDRVRADPGPLLWGHGWDETAWPERRPPSRIELDAACGTTPVYLSRVDVHSALVSTALVDRAPGARSAPGWSATGPLSRDAHHHARRAAGDAITAEQRRDAQVAFLRHAASMGIVSVHECGGPDISGYQDLTELLNWRGDLPAVVGYWGELGTRPAAAHGLAGDLFVDGALGSRTAALTEPYTDRPDTTGARYLDAEAIAEHVAACSAAGIQAGFHVIGDAAVATVVEGFAMAEKRVGADVLRAVRHRLEHLEMVDAEQADRIAALGVVASVQPLFDAYWGGQDGMYAQRVGARAAAMNPFALLHEAGVALAFGSDTPVTTVDPWATVRAAVHHRTPGAGLPPDVAFAAHTAGGWHAAGSTDPLAGRLAVGAPATYAVWDVPELAGDLPRLDPDTPLPGCLRTVHNGKTIFEVE